MVDTLFVATRKGLFRFRRHAQGWRQDEVHFLGDPVTLVTATDTDNSVYAALNLGHFGVKLHRSEDGGRHFEPCTTPAFPVDEQDPAAAPGVELLWALEHGGQDQPGRLWCGTIPGALFVTDDSGQSWSLVSSLWEREERKEWCGGGYDNPGIHSICVDPRDSRHVTVGVSTGGVWTTRDDGATWACCSQGMRAAYLPPDMQHNPNLQDVHRLVSCAASPDVFWAQHHNGIFRTTDSRQWYEVSCADPSSFGFAVAVHPQDPDTAWFVPAQKDECRVPVDGALVVTRTRDGGKSFELLRSGLPQTHAYDLVYRHALAIDASGNTLAFGSTTGGLWISDEQGEHWQCLSVHLPPINCVQFGEYRG